MFEYWPEISAYLEEDPRNIFLLLITITGFWAFSAVFILNIYDLIRGYWCTGEIVEYKRARHLWGLYSGYYAIVRYQDKEGKTHKNRLNHSMLSFPHTDDKFYALYAKGRLIDAQSFLFSNIISGAMFSIVLLFFLIPTFIGKFAFFIVMACYSSFFIAFYIVRYKEFKLNGKNPSALIKNTKEMIAAYRENNKISKVKLSKEEYETLKAKDFLSYEEAIRMQNQDIDSPVLYVLAILAALLFSYFYIR